LNKEKKESATKLGRYSSQKTMLVVPRKQKPRQKTMLLKFAFVFRGFFSLKHAVNRSSAYYTTP
jgi:hypothetical protein